MNEEKLEVSFDIDGSEVRLTPSIVKNFITGGKDLSTPEYKYFTELCKVRKLNPFLKEVYAIKFGDGPAQIVVGKDAIVKRAVTHPQYDGREQGIIVQAPDGALDFRKGTFRLANEKLVGGWARVYRKDWSHPTDVTVSFDEVAQKKSSGELNSNWANKGATMVEKVALVRALRETFVEDLGGMIDADEAWSLEEKAEKSEPKTERMMASPKQLEILETLLTEEEIAGIDIDTLTLAEASALIKSKQEAK